MPRTRKPKLRADFNMGVPELIVRADLILAYYIRHPAIPDPRPSYLPTPAELEEAIEALRDHYTEVLRGDEQKELARDRAVETLKHSLGCIARYYEAVALNDPALLTDTGFEECRQQRLTLVVSRSQLKTHFLDTALPPRDEAEAMSRAQG